MATQLSKLKKISGKLTSAVNNANRMSPDYPYIGKRDRVVDTLLDAQEKVMGSLVADPGESRTMLAAAFTEVSVAASNLATVYGSGYVYRGVAIWQMNSAADKIANLLSP